MRLSVIVLTHRRPDALALVLAGLARQTEAPDEVVVTEDGQDPATRTAVLAAAPGFAARLLHLAQPPATAGRSRARNRGIAAACGDYLVFLDGDMVPGPFFVEDHKAFARRGSFVQGSRVGSTDAGAKALLARSATDPRLLSPGLRRRRYLLRSRLLRLLLSRPRTDTRGVKSCNLAFWREDLVRLNGFDETMSGWGREDGELAHRAFHAGLVRRDLRFGAVAVHLWHPRRERPAPNPNDAVEAATVALKRIRCENGLDAHLAASPESADLRAPEAPATVPGRSGGGSAARSTRKPVDVFVNHCEVNDRHGTGVLMQRLFGDEPGAVSIRSRDRYGGEQRFGAVRIRLRHGSSPRGAVHAAVLKACRNIEVGRVLCVPYYPDDCRTAVALREIFGCPLCTWVMDDQNVECAGIPDEVLRELLERSHLRLAISVPLRDAYQRKFGLPFSFVPPVAEAAYVTDTPRLPPPEALAARRGLMLGNVWDETWLSMLAETVRHSGVELDWYSNRGTPWMRIDGDQLAAAGVHVRGALPEADLVAALRRSPFAVVPSGTFEGPDSHRFIARLSIPSRITYVVATSGTPLVVLGHPDTAAARFVTSLGVGVAVPYDRSRFAAAAGEVSTLAAQERFRARAAELAPRLSSAGVREWIWRSLEAGRPVDDRWEALAHPHPRTERRAE